MASVEKAFPRVLASAKDAAEVVIALNRDVLPVLQSMRSVVNARFGNLASITLADTPYTVPPDVEVILVDTTLGNVTVSLPAPSGYYRQLLVKNVDATNDVILTPEAGVTIDGASTFTLDATTPSCMVLSDMTSYFVWA